MGGGRAGSLLLHRCALVAVSGAHSLVVVPGLLVAAASLAMEHGPQGPQASGVAQHGLRSCGSQAVEHRLDGVVPGLLIAVASIAMERGPQGPQASVGAEHGLSGCDPQAVEHRLDGCGS